MSEHAKSLEKKNDGLMRKVGFEIEFSGLEIEVIVDIVKETYGGKAEKVNDYKYIVTGTELGDFRVELDVSLLKEMVLKEYLYKIGLSNQEEIGAIEKAVAAMVKQIAPFEVCSPPIPIDAIAKIDLLRENLRKQYALGTGASPMYAFGLHINAEIPSVCGKLALNYMRAFFILYDWLKEKLKLDLTRQLTPYINPFPREYQRLVLDRNYCPGEKQLIEDYIKFNPTRNRPLDMLPLFCFMNEELLRERIVDELTTPRPTFHYRMPNSKLDDPNWRIMDEWGCWMEVEKLAHSEDQLNRLINDYMQRFESPLGYYTEKWLQEIKRIIDN
ncbi:hypothetical protein GGQ84_000222 [Desulfitispora alkaliphila]|uniref:amidoligase family protein n=1 Tax=Desulfitispora alkaliphila TaxID=622674 RepID=UPI003D21ACCA